MTLAAVTLETPFCRCDGLFETAERSVAERCAPWACSSGWAGIRIGRADRRAGHRGARVIPQCGGALRLAPSLEQALPAQERDGQGAAKMYSRGPHIALAWRPCGEGRGW